MDLGASTRRMSPAGWLIVNATPQTISYPICDELYLPLRQLTRYSILASRTIYTLRSSIALATIPALNSFQHGLTVCSHPEKPSLYCY